jgi:hypothetical protein
MATQIIRMNGDT